MALFPLMLLSSLSEVVSIGAVVPFIAVLTSPDTLYESEFLQPVIKTLGFTEPQELLFPVTLFFILAAITAGALRLFLLWVQTRLSHGIGADLGLSIYDMTLYQSYELHLTRNTSEILDMTCSCFCIKTFSITFLTDL